MNKKPDGGPVHPGKIEVEDNVLYRGKPVGKAHRIVDATGLTVRDYFAALAMQALIVKSPFLAEPQTFEVYGKTAIGAYDYADAMLVERAK